jgi:hypothetical protein
MRPQCRELAEFPSRSSRLGSARCTSAHPGLGPKGLGLLKDETEGRLSASSCRWTPPAMGHQGGAQRWPGPPEGQKCRESGLSVSGLSAAGLRARECIFTSAREKRGSASVKAAGSESVVHPLILCMPRPCQRFRRLAAQNDWLEPTNSSGELAIPSTYCSPPLAMRNNIRHRD